VVDRLGPSLYSAASVAAQALARAQIPESAAATLANRRPPAWVFLHGLKSPLSSTALRAERHQSHKTAVETGETPDVATPERVARAGAGELAPALPARPGT
jgi:nicotinate-nucleotide adenylyltransferase